MPIIKDFTLYDFSNSHFMKLSDDPVFNRLHSHDGTPAPFAGIYTCTVCEREIVISKGKTLPPCGNKKAHELDPFKIAEWQLTAAANEKDRPSIK